MKLLTALLLILLQILASFTYSQEPIKKVKYIGLLAFNRVLTSEVTAPFEVFGAASKKEWFSDYKVVIISCAKDKSIVTEEGLKLTADYTIFDDLNLEALMVPGAYDLSAITKNSNTMDFIKNNGSKVRWLGSNCSGAFILAHAGLLNKIKATTWAGGEADLKKAYPAVDVQFNKNVVIDGRIITSNGGVVSYEAAFALLEKLTSKEKSNEIAELLQFNRLN